MRVNGLGGERAEDINAEDINWELSPVAPAPAADIDLLTCAIAEAQSYRLLAQVALHELHNVTLERDLLKQQRMLDRRREREKDRR